MPLTEFLTATAGCNESPVRRISLIRQAPRHAGATGYVPQSGYTSPGAGKVVMTAAVTAVDRSQCVTELSYFVALWVEGSFFSAAAGRAGGLKPGEAGRDNLLCSDLANDDTDSL